LRIARGIEIIRAINEEFEKLENTTLKNKAIAKIVTRVNQILRTIVTLYFIKRKTRKIASTNENNIEGKIERKFECGLTFLLSRPKGRVFSGFK